MFKDKQKIINYQDKWKVQKVEVKDLVLDINNARLDNTGHESQDEIINDLFLNEKAMEVLISIHQNGYFPDEPPVVVRENKKLVVLDGNRRVVSLKAMITPAIVPSKFIHRIEKLMINHSPIEDIFVHVATSRDEAMQYLAAKHTKTTRKAWSALRRAYFYYAQKEQGQAVEKLIERYKGVDIPSYIKMYEMHNVALSLKNTSQGISQKISNKRTFPISTLERLYSDKYVQEKLGIEFNKQTGEATVPSGNDFDKVYSRIITDIVSGIATSRKELSKENDRKKYLNSVIDEVLGKNKEIKKIKKLASTFKPPTTKEKKKKILISTKLINPFDCPGIGRVLWELQTVDYTKFPNATADLLRTFLEIVIKKYLEEKGVLPSPKRSGGYIFLDDVLSKIESELKKVSNHRIVQVIQEIKQNKWYLDSINHNPDVFAVHERVEDAWDQIYPLIKYIFDEYKKNNPNI